MRDTAPHPAVIAPERVSGTWARTFPAAADQVREARRFLAAILSGSPLTDDALLCLSELVTNSIQHSNSARTGGTLTVRVRLRPPRLLVDVEDQGGPWAPRPHSGSQRGRGLQIVGELADTWQVSGDGATARTVSFQMELR